MVCTLADAYRCFRATAIDALVIGIVNTWLLLCAEFFGILTPVGWVLRRTARLQYSTRFDREAPSYRIEVPPDRPLHLGEPFGEDRHAAVLVLQHGEVPLGHRARGGLDPRGVATALDGLL